MQCSATSGSWRGVEATVLWYRYRISSRLLLPGWMVDGLLRAARGSTVPPPPKKLNPTHHRRALFELPFTEHLGGRPPIPGNSVRPSFIHGAPPPFHRVRRLRCPYLSGPTVDRTIGMRLSFPHYACVDAASTTQIHPQRSEGSPTVDLPLANSDAVACAPCEDAGESNVRSD